jgi:hypothetical protein
VEEDVEDVDQDEDEDDEEYDVERIDFGVDNFV